jgi:hypothetical protein
MWLRDYLGEDVPNVRILTYGYEARLDKTTTMSRLLDYRRAFLRDMIHLRRSLKVFTFQKLFENIDPLRNTDKMSS